ncbi:MAG: putative amidase [Rhizobacter sp.]|nr:putative amidase [Rhizobacter sp.]
MSNDWHYLDLLEIGKRIQSREISSVEATQAQLARIEAIDGKTRSYVRTMSESALAEARKADAEIAQGMSKGRLHGVPVAVKDLCWTAGVPTAAGMEIYKDFVPTEDGTAVRKLREGGAVILGKLKLTESAYADHHEVFPAPINPWNPAHWVGSSSSGSGVATASGLCYGSLGTDTGGSIRFPSAANGLTGIKPTWGRVSRYGAFELAATLDHIGPMCRSAADAGAMLGVIAGPDEKDPTAVQLPVLDYLADMTRGVEGLRVGIDSRWNSQGVDEPTRVAIAAAIKAVEKLGGELIEVTFPDTTQMTIDWFPLCGIETAVAHESTYPAKKAQYGSSLAGLIDLGRAQSGMDYQKIVLRRIDFTGRVRALFERVDLMLIPVTGIASPTLELMGSFGDNADLMNSMLSYTCPLDMSGNPTITFPAGMTDAGTPIGLQFVARHFEEDLLVRAGWAFQQVSDWHQKHPSL